MTIAASSETDGAIEMLPADNSLSISYTSFSAPVEDPVGGDPQPIKASSGGGGSAGPFGLGLMITFFLWRKLQIFMRR